MKITTFNIDALAIALFLFLTPSVSNAQMRFGIKAGLNATNVSFEKLPSKSERYGFHVGLFADIPIKEDFVSIQPELSFSTKGAAFKPLTGRQTLNMSYVDFLLPVAFKLSMFDVLVGPFASYLASTPDYTVYNENRIIVDGFKKYDLGLTVGLAANFNKIVIGLRYNQGFVDVTTDNARPFLGTGKNAVAQLSLGYKF
jgi:Outer membrane protein beta-barrel domain